ncbi:MAG TPA: cytochrome ubiquinol oxidase subunit I, partial [Longilinea sp.]|nr:cytochrome ubiquinol oxidase subunit I [Longilinea sp.]
VALSRWQFGITSVYHFFFVPLTLGLGILVAILQTLYYRNKKEAYKRATKFWGTLFLINFAMGVVTGIVMEFQFGMNWSEYSRTVGDIFGAPLAIEALVAFFIESTFLGLWIFGWDRLPKGIHLASIWLAALAANISAFWILVANSFMQHPVGYEIVDGHLVMNNFSALLTNPYVWAQFPHTVLAGFTTGAFFMLGISAYYLLRKKELDVFTPSFKLAAIVGLIAITGTIFMGDQEGKMLGRLAPMKVAAMEGLWETEDPASFSIIATIDEEAGENPFALRVPGVLSFLMYNRFYGEIQGMDELNEQYQTEYGAGNYIPPVTLIFWSFRIMVGLGMLMLLICIYLIYFVIRKKDYSKIPLLGLLPFTIAFPYLANSFGWIMTEMGRQPWVVFGILRTSDAVSTVLVNNPGMVLTSLILFTLVYGILMLVDVYLLVKYSKIVPGEGVGHPTSDSSVSNPLA